MFSQRAAQSTRQCLVSNTGDIETVCVSNAVAIIETFEGQKKIGNTIKIKGL